MKSIKSIALLMVLGLLLQFTIGLADNNQSVVHTARLGDLEDVKTALDGPQLEDRNKSLVWDAQRGDLENVKIALGDPEIDIEFTTVKGPFDPELIKKLSKEWKIPINFMFIGSPGDKFPYRLEDLVGVQLII